MRTYCIRLAYDGTEYAGWQRQSNAPSIQAAVEAAAAKINGAPTDVLGAGRTDAGVHALRQAARFRTSRDISEERVPYALNTGLPDDIVVLDAMERPASFHPIGDATGKRYRYTLRRAPFDSPFDRRYVHRIDDRPDLDAMRAAAAVLEGTHDFRGFEKSGSPRPSTVRTLRRVAIRESDAYIWLEFEGDGFLYGMARNLAGSLLRVGRHKLAPDVLAAGLEAADPSVAGPCMPAAGLTLVDVAYPFARRGEWSV
ncbi:MAG: tRNA pseudouridine(38-40) synthase TruA [Planctomycetota bacterium]